LKNYNYVRLGDVLKLEAHMVLEQTKVLPAQFTPSGFASALEVAKKA